MNGRRIYNFPVVKDNNVKFVYHNAEATDVKVAGSFNDWQPSIHLLKEDDGYWVSEIVKLKNHNTVYGYKFFIDENLYIADPMNYFKKDSKYGFYSLLYVWENPEGFEEFLIKIDEDLKSCSPQTVATAVKRESIIKKIDDYFSIMSINRSVSLNKFFVRRISAALEEIKNYKVQDGLKIWSIYNDGFIIKTKTTTFGIDVVTTDSIKGLDWDIDETLFDNLSSVLDFLLITHSHSDHSDDELIKNMLKKNKKVFVCKDDEMLYNKKISTFVQGEKFEYNNQLIFPFKGVHVYDNNRNINISYFQIFTDADINIIHTGDHDYTQYLNYRNKIDCIIPRLSGVNAEYSIWDYFKVLNKIEPKVVIPGHIIELSHLPGGGRGTYKEILSNILTFNIPTYILMWAESCHLIL